jgi:hypothetical protein
VSEPDPRPTAVTRLLAWLGRWRTPPPRWRGVILLLAVSLFVGGVVVSVRELDLDAATIRWWPLVLVAVLGTPATIVTNAAELRAMGRCLDATRPLPPELSWWAATRVVVVATAANVLPLPGGALVRVHALRSAGSTVPRATGVNVVAALVWVAIAISVAGAAALTRAPVLGAIGLGVGSLGVVASLALLRPMATRWAWAPVIQLVVVEVVTTLIHAVRLYGVLLGLGIAVVPAQALVLGAASPLAAAAGVFPSGLGLAELLSALLAPAVALSAAGAFAATAVARIIGLGATAPLALMLGVRDLLPAAADLDASEDRGA